MHRPPRPWAPAPFFWNASPPRPYHSYGYSDFYKSKTDEAQDESGTTIKQGPEVEDVPDESEAEAEDVSSDIEESDEDSGKSSFRVAITLKRASELAGKALPRVYAPRFPKVSQISPIINGDFQGSSDSLFV